MHKVEIVVISSKDGGVVKFTIQEADIEKAKQRTIEGWPGSRSVLLSFCYRSHPKPEWTTPGPPKALNLEPYTLALKP